MSLSETSKMENEAPGTSEPRAVDNPDLPVGDSPARSAWPLVLTGIAWLLWVVFLVAMMMSRLSTGA